MVRRKRKPILVLLTRRDLEESIVNAGARRKVQPVEMEVGRFREIVDEPDRHILSGPQLQLRSRKLAVVGQEFY